MFCDLVGSSALAEQVDPEDLRDLLAQYQDTCARVINRYGGHIARYVGDGLLVYFGYPQAHEDDTARGVRAALDIVDAIRDLRAGILAAGRNLEVRIGITTGLVVAGDIGSGERVEADAVVGETPNLAARLQAIAEPNGILIGASTQQLIEGLFECDDLGEQDLKGISRPVRAYRIRAESGVPSRFEAKVARGLTPLVGREAEVELLLRRWRQAKEGEGQVVLLSGEAGVGKSRIIRGFQEDLGGVRNRVLYYGSPYRQNSALYPAVEQLERGLRFRKNDTADQKLDKLEAVLADFDLPVENHAPFLASLLSVPFNRRYPLLELAPQELKYEMLRSLITLFDRMAAQDTVLAVVEDAHWIDPSTLELIGLLIEQLRSARILLIIVFRPEFVAPWGRFPNITALTLNRLSRKESAEMIARITKNKTLPGEVVDQIIENSDGVPLFVEELTKTLLETDLLKDTGDQYALGASLRKLAIPASLQDSLMARLDRLGPVKEVAELAATCGRSFSRELLLAVSSLEEDRMNNALRQLCDAELIFRRGIPPNAIYEFKHALVQDAAYHALLKTTRQKYHEAIANALKKQSPATSEPHPELVAHHYTEAGLAAEAIPYWHRAGQRAVERSGNREAVAHLTKCLELIKTLQGTTERAKQELELYLMLGPALVATQGFVDPGVGRAYACAGELCRRLEDNARLPLVLRGRQVFHLMRGELSKARKISQQLVAFANGQKNSALLVGGCHALGQTLFQMGELATARQTVEKGIELFDPRHHRLQNWPGGQPGEQCYLYAAFVLWMLGYPDQALRLGEDALDLAEELSNPANLINTLAFVALVHVFRRELAAARQRANAAMEMSHRHKNRYFLTWGRILHGWVQAAEKRFEDGISEIHQGIVEYRTTGSRNWLPYFLALQAETCAWAEQYNDGLAAVAEALELIEETEQRAWQAELNRIKGELLLAASRENRANAELCMFQALDIAHRQQAKSWELRAALSLGRLWKEQGDSEKVPNLLGPIYGGFTEGLDTADLRDARALLDAVG